MDLPKTNRRQFIQLGGVAGAGMIVPVGVWRVLSSGGSHRASDPQTAIDPTTIPKFVSPLPTFVGSRLDQAQYRVSIEEFRQFVLPQSMYAGLAAPFNQGTYLWGHRNGGTPAHWPGTTVIAHRGTPTTATYVNNLPTVPRSVVEPFLPMDQTLMWANPLNTPPSNQIYQGVYPIAVHLHGAEVPSEFDGTSNEWFTQNGIHGKGYSTLRPTAANSAVYRYPNTQQTLAMMFHPHERGLTRFGAYAGMASQYWLRDQFDSGLTNNPLGLPAQQFEIEMTFQDRNFDTNGQLFYPVDPGDPFVHPFWDADFFQPVICVNGTAWPFMSVEPRRYRFRLLNISNMRWFRLWVENAQTGAVLPIWQLGTDGGFLDKPVKLSTDPADTNDVGGTKLLLGTTERSDVILDFTGLQGQTLTMRNDGPSPLRPGDEGTAPDPALDGSVMQFKVNKPLSSQDTTFNPASGGSLRGGRNQPPAIVRLANPATGQLAPGVKPSVTRQLTFLEFDSGPNEELTVEYLINNMIMDGVRQGTTIQVADSQPDRGGQGMFLTELPRQGDTELWEFFLLTDESHPIHIHLIEFQILNRQPADPDSYRTNAYNVAFPGGTFYGTLADGSAGLVNYPPGVFIPGYGPPHDYNTPNADGAIGGNPAFSPFYTGPIIPPEIYEAGWKDVFHALNDHVNRAVCRWAPTDIPVGGVQAGQNAFAFDPTVGPGYMFHCHMFEHEDNELMHMFILNK